MLATISGTISANYTTNLSGVKLIITLAQAATSPDTNLGIKIISSGNSITSGCTPNANGYCIFSISPNQPANIYLSHLQTSMTIELCADGLLPDGCQTSTITDPISLYVGTQYGNLLNSSDGGNSWIATPLPGGGNLNFGLYIIPSSSQVGYNIYVGGSNGNLLVSTDGGNSWANTGTQPDHTQIQSVYAVDEQTIYVGTSGATGSTTAAPYYGAGNAAFSVDKGQSWTIVNPPPPNLIINNTIAGIGYDSTIFALSTEAIAGGYSGLYSYDANSSSWTSFYPTDGSLYNFYSLFFVSANKYLLGGYNFLQICNQNTCTTVGNTGTHQISGSVSGASVLPDDSIYFVGTENDSVQMSTDGGVNWYNYTNYVGTSTFNYPWSIFFYGSKLYVGSGDGNIYWTSGYASPMTAKFYNLTPPGGNLNYGLFIDENHTFYLGGTNGNVLYSTNDGQNWSAVQGSPGQGGQTFDISYANDYYYAATEDSGIQYKLNMPNSYWSQDGCTNQYSQSTIYALTVRENTIYYGGSNDGGNNYQVITEDTATLSRCGHFGPNLPNPDVQAIYSIYFQDSNTVYVGTNNGIYSWTQNSGMASWVYIRPPQNVNSLNVWGLYVDNSGSIYASWDNNLYVTSDGGNNWVTVNSIPDGSLVLSMATTQIS